MSNFASCHAAASCFALLLLWCARLLSALAVCCVTSCHAAASLPPVPPSFIAPPPLITPLSYLLSGWMLHCLSLRQCLLSASFSDSCCVEASGCAPLVPPVHFGCCRVASDVVQNGLRSCRHHCKEMRAKLEHPFVRVLGGQLILACIVSENSQAMETLPLLGCSMSTLMLVKRLSLQGQEHFLSIYCLPPNS